MASPTTLTIRPRIGRGLNTRFGGTDSGELWDTMLEFRNVISQEGAWFPRRLDQQTVVGVTGPVRSIHYYNKIIDTNGTVQTQQVFVANNLLKDGTLATIETLSPPYDLFYSNVKNRLFYGGANNEPRVWNGTTLASWGAFGPIGALTYSALTTDSVDSAIQAQTVDVTNGSPTVTRVSGGPFAADPAWVGKTIMIVGVEYTIQSVGGANTLTLATNYLGATAAGAPAQVHYGNRSWTASPKYAYVYYNPTTGHTTNGSPVLTLAETVMTNVNVSLGTIVTNATLFGYGYTKIVLFRSPRDGATLLPLKLPAGRGDGNGFFDNTGGPLAFIDQTDDSVLGQILGLKEMPFENDPCPQHRGQAYWRGRFWVIDETQPWRLRYSADPSLSLGVPEESWPPQNFIDVSTEDGYATSLKVIGSSLIVATGRFAYFMGGQSPADFQLERLSTRGFGIASRAIDEHPGDSSEQSASAIYVSRDKRLWRHFEGGKIEDIGSPIQEFLDNVPSLGLTPSPYLVNVFMLERYWLLALGIASQAMTTDPLYDVYFYDFDTQMWMDWGFNGAEAATNIVSAMAPFIFRAPGNSADGTARFALYQNGTTYNDVAGSDNRQTGTLRTRFIDSGDWNKKKMFQALRLYTSDDDQPFVVKLKIDGVETTEYTLTRASTAQSPRIKGGQIMEYVYKGGPLHYHAVSVSVTLPPDSKLYRIDVDITPESTGEAGAPS